MKKVGGKEGKGLWIYAIYIYIYIHMDAMYISMFQQLPQV